MEPLQTWWTTELYPTSDEDNFGVVGNFEVVKAADAQATIAALQDERDGWVRSREHYYQLWMRATDERDEMRKERDEFEAQLTQRTAELERVRADNKALDEWRADVTVSLQRPGGAFFVDVPQHIKDLVKERDDLRTLLLALPKVEGAVVVSNGYVKGSTRCHALFGADEDAALYAALLQHRQGMEGV